MIFPKDHNCLVTASKGIKLDEMPGYKNFLKLIEV
jgi:hypothetical protein